MQEYKIEKQAFKSDEQLDGYMFEAWYLTEPKGDALIKITKDDQVVKEFLFPAYKIWNIAAHANDIVEGLKKESDSGLYMAGATGFGGNVYNSED